MKNILNQSAATYNALVSIMDLEGCGFPGSQVIVTDAAPFTVDGDDDADGEVFFAYKIYCLTAGCTFAELKEDGVDVHADLLDGGDSGYPVGTVLNGKFSDIQMAAASIALISIV